MLISKFKLYELNILKKLSFNHKDTSEFKKSIHGWNAHFNNEDIYKAIYENSFRLFLLYKHKYLEDPFYEYYSDLLGNTDIIEYAMIIKHKELFLLLQKDELDRCHEDIDNIDPISHRICHTNDAEYVDLLEYQGHYGRALSLRIYEPNNPTKYRKVPLNLPLIFYYTALAENANLSLSTCEVYKMYKLREAIERIRG